MFLCVCLSVCPLAGQMMCLSFLYGGLSLGPGFADKIEKKWREERHKERFLEDKKIEVRRGETSEDK